MALPVHSDQVELSPKRERPVSVGFLTIKFWVIELCQQLARVVLRIIRFLIPVHLRWCSIVNTRISVKYNLAAPKLQEWS
jgi:hypothetical protein